MRRLRFIRGGKASRTLAIVGAALLLIGAIGGMKFAQIRSLMAMGEQMEAMGPEPEAVGVATCETQSWERTIAAVGTIAGVRSVEIRNEVAGIVEALHFDSGDRVEAGAPLVELDARRERSQLEAARARLENARSTFERTRRLLEQGVFARAQFEEASAAFEVARGEVQALEASLAQKRVRAPFAGRLGIREISLGQFLQPGTRITVLDALGEAFVDFSLPQEQWHAIAEGMPVRARLRGARPLEGSVVAIEPSVDPVTRNVKVRAHLRDPEAHLLPGMFVDVEVVLPQAVEVVAVPRTAIVYAPYGNSVFVVEEKPPDAPGMRRTPDGREVFVARQQFVRIGMERGDFVQVVQGLRPGQRVVSAGAFKLRNLSPIVIGEPQARPSLEPRLENR